MNAATDPGAILPELVALPGGEFVMGHDERRRDERPAHRVRLGPFRAAVCPVTNAEYSRYVEASGAALPRFNDDPVFNAAAQPVVGVSWHEVTAYCNWLAAETTVPYRLPTEAEREFAARGGHKSDWPWGESEPAYYRPQQFVAEAAGPHVPRVECANQFGLRCMAENVHEWCDDFYQRDYYEQSATESPRGPATGMRRASRGGSWRHRIKFTRVSARSSLSPGYRYNDYGFRLYADAQ